jgi:protein transport protein SEC23
MITRENVSNSLVMI